MYRHLIHYGMHFLLPLVIAWTCFGKYRLRASLILLGGILIDADHLLAHPVFDTTRCSIGFQVLHSNWAILIYFLLLLYKDTRIFGLALVLHIAADLTDCWLLACSPD